MSDRLTEIKEIFDLVIADTNIPKFRYLHRDDVAFLLSEIYRLKSGKFTEEEFQNLCHNFSEDDVCRFKKGCEEYQAKLFGNKANVENK